jgi:hypothetical protein
MRTRKRHVVSWLAIVFAAAAVLAPATVQAGTDYPDGRVSLTQAKVQAARDYPDGRALRLSRSPDVVSSVTTGPVASGSTVLSAMPGHGFNWADAAIGAASSLALVALVAAAATLITRHRRTLRSA